MSVTAPLTMCFDEVYRSHDSLTFRVSSENRQRPVFLYWVGMFCLMAPESMHAVGAEEVTGPRDRFVYTFEMNWDLREWSYISPGSTMVELPRSVERAVRDRRALVLVSFAHEGRAHYLPEELYGETTLFEQYLHAQGGRPDVCVFDKLSELAQRYELLPEQLWFATGNMSAPDEEAAWRKDRGLASSPFTLRVCELSSAAVGLSTRESVQRGRAPSAVPVYVSDYNPTGLSNWQQLKIRWVDRPSPSYAPGEAWDDPRWRYACMNRRFRRHRWWVVQRLAEEGLLDYGRVSFPVANFVDLLRSDLDPIPVGDVPLLEALPLRLDLPLAHVTRSRSFMAENAYTVSTSPSVVMRDCALEIVTETYYGGGRLVTEKTFKALLDRGPAVILGSWGTIDYLKAIGVETWSKVIDESYDLVGRPETDESDRSRFEAVMEAVLPIIRDREQSLKVSHACHRQFEHNLRWLLEAEKPWDRLLAELGRTLKDL